MRSLPEYYRCADSPFRRSRHTRADAYPFTENSYELTRTSRRVSRLAFRAVSFGSSFLNQVFMVFLQQEQRSVRGRVRQ